MAEHAEVLLGNLSYDDFFGGAAPAEPWTRPQAEPVYEPQTVPAVEPEAAPGERVRVRPRRAVRRQTVSLLGVLGSLGVAAAMVLFLQANIRVAALSNEAARLETHIRLLQQEQTRLEIAYESTFDMAQVESYAKTQLGMVKAGADQVSYVNNRGGDAAIILTQREARDGIFAKLRRAVDSALAYLP